MITELFWEKWHVQKVSTSFFLGIFAVIVSFITSQIVFSKVPHFIGIATIMFSALLSVPLFSRLLLWEEKQDLKKHNFLKRHEGSFDFYIYYFLGVFLVFLLLSLVTPELVFAKTDLFPVKEVVQFDFELPKTPPIVKTPLSIFQNNFIVMAVAFAVSIIYGSGAIFLILLNASMGASALSEFMLKQGATVSSIACNASIFSIHFIPEMTAFIMAAVGGGILSKALIKENRHNLKIILIDSAILFIMSTIILYGSAILELAVSKKLFDSAVCQTTTSYAIILVAFLTIFIFFELIRKEQVFKRSRTKFLSKKTKL